jgi:hypothetical protein
MDSEIEERGSVLFGVPRGMTGQIASGLIDDGVLEELMTPQKSYWEIRRKEMRRVLYNLIRAQSLSRAHSREIKVAVPLAMIHDNEKEYHRVSHRGVKSVLEAFGEAGLIGIERGKPFLQCRASWKKKCVEKNNLKGKMTEVWARGELEEKIEDYLDETTDVGADVEILVEEEAVVLKDNDGGYIRMENGEKARRMRKTVEEVNGAVPQSGVRLMLPLSFFSPLSTPSSPIREHTSLQRRSEGISWASLPPDMLCSRLSPHTNASSSIREHTSPQRRHEMVSRAVESKLEATHNEVKRRCPQAWSWNHRLSEDGSHISYEIPNLALLFNRTFVRGSWNCGGRFYADVQNVPSDWRKHMRIGGEPACELDYDNLHIAMLYAEEGRRLEGDAYDITAQFDLGEEMDRVVGLAEEEKQFYRDGQRTVVKRALNTLINASNYQSAYKALKHREWEEEIGVPIANGVFKPLVDALKSKHTPISDHFHSDVGIRLQRKDSDLAYRVMTETCAIGIHDGFVIEASREEELREAMKQAFAEAYDGYDIGVSREFKPLTEDTGGALGEDRDFAPDRPASAESGAELKSKHSQSLHKVRSELFYAPQNGSESPRPFSSFYSSARNTNTLYSASDWSTSSCPGVFADFTSNSPWVFFSMYLLKPDTRP